MDNVQLSKSGWTHRDKIKTSKEVSWITIPIKNIKKKKLIKDCLIDHDINWKKKHINMISESYKNSKFINEGIEIINELNGDENSDENDGKTKIPISKRFWDVWNRGFMPNGMSMADPEARRILFLMSLVVGKTVAAGGIAYYDGFLLTTVLQSKWSVFFKRISLAVVMRSSLALFDATMTRQKWYVTIKMKQEQM